MPGWHQQTKKLVANGQLAVAGIVQEQHPDRAALYMQWQQMDWPVLSDPFNDLAISAVPITLLIDEHGIIRYRNPKPKDLQRFLQTTYSDQAEKQPVRLLPRGIEELESLLAQSPKNATAHFRLGVAYRMRFDSEKRQFDDFAKAMSHWQTALELNPNQYIWRRRIQQYGPRLDKPYSFYDWVSQARREISQRGEVALPLTAEPSGAEFAVPSRSAGRGKKETALKHPDPQGQVARDTKGLVSSRTVIVASTNRKQSAVRVHLTLQPGELTTWTNDAGNVSFHLDPDSPVEVRDLKIPTLPKSDSSAETRVVEFELHPKAGQPLPDKISASAFYYVCTKSDHTCQFLRSDMMITLKK
ncbi:thioredoxin family protein [Verrucomicrobiaceae bacterium R5-34]|nr:thioredoxin family protein [Verrucomicrobiaceae bacterium R5-34]